MSLHRKPLVLIARLVTTFAVAGLIAVVITHVDDPIVMGTSVGLGLAAIVPIWTLRLGLPPTSPTPVVPAPVPTPHRTERPAPSPYPDPNGPVACEDVLGAVAYVEARLSGGQDVEGVDNALPVSTKQRIDTAIEAFHRRHAHGDVQQTWLATLAGRLLAPLDQLNIDVEDLRSRTDDPDLLNCSFRIDRGIHQLKRLANNLDILSLKASAMHVASREGRYYIDDAVKSGIAQVPGYRIPNIDVTDQYRLPAAAGEAVKHIITELTANATKASNAVDVFDRAFPTGLAIEIVDGGWSMAPETVENINRMLSACHWSDIQQARSASKFGLAVVALLARSYGIAVELRTSMYRGIRAVVFIPKELFISDDPPTPAHPNRPSPEIKTASSAEAADTKPSVVATSDHTSAVAVDVSWQKPAANPHPQSTQDKPPPLPQRQSRQNAPPALPQRTAGDATAGPVSSMTDQDTTAAAEAHEAEAPLPDVTLFATLFDNRHQG